MKYGPFDFKELNCLQEQVEEKESEDETN